MTATPSSKRRLLAVGLMVVVAGVAVTLAVATVANKSSDTTATTRASERSGDDSAPTANNSTNSTNASTTTTTTTAPAAVGFANLTADGSEDGQATVRPDAGATASAAKAAATPEPADPTKVTFSLHALAIGDWGVSPGGDSCCSKYAKEDGESLYRDQQAQSNVGYLLSLSAQSLAPKVILSHGDNFYWNGLGVEDQAYRFANTFEAMYDQKALAGIPWLNVMGNHDYGGSALLCGSKDGEWVKCTSEKEVEAALDSRFTVQSGYTSPNGDRWKLPSHYYKETITDDASGVTVDIFNVDTNAATVHGAEQVCCQCYGYAPSDKTDPDYVNCNTVHRGHKYCFGGDNTLFDACSAKFTAWTQDSLKQLLSDTQASKADWKIVNSHYSPHYHMAPTMMKTWFDALEKGGVQLFINGHTHAESHDASDFNTHFITNGAGGGIQSESIGSPPPYVTNVKTVWSGANSPYGFFELSFSKKWLRARFMTFDKQWTFAKDASETVRGSTQVGHCWYIPIDGSKGQECTA